MKRLSLITTIAVFLLSMLIGIQAQTTQTKLNQIELAKQFLGTWQANTGKDTVQGWEGKPYGKTVIANIYMVIKGIKSDIYLSCFGYDGRDDKLKGYNLLTNADFVTWIGAFTADKILKLDIVDTFKPEIIWVKAEFELKLPQKYL